MKYVKNFWILTVFWPSGFFRDFLKIPWIFGKSPKFGIFYLRDQDFFREKGYTDKKPTLPGILFMHKIVRNLSFQVRFLKNRHSWIQNLRNKRVTNCQNFEFWKDPCALTVTQWTSPEPNTHARNNRAHIHYYDQ